MKTNWNNAKLKPEQVQAVRDLHRAGFRASTIADSFEVCRRTVADILKRRSWTFLADVASSLPLLAVDESNRLALRCARKLSKVQRQQIADYQMRLAMHHELEAEREGVAVSRLLDWTHKERRTATKQGAERSNPAGVGGLIF